MKKLIVLTCLFGLLMGLSSCSNYFYTTLNSNDRIGSYDENKDYVLENDSVIVSYCFYGEDAPVTIRIYNKLDEPLYVDWQRSALIVGDMATSFYKENVPIRGVTQSNSQSSSYRWGHGWTDTYSSSSGSFSGEMVVPRGTEFIPPKSKIEASLLKLEKLPFKELPKEIFATQRFARLNNQVIDLKSATFTEEDTPLRFRIYLSLFTGKETLKYRTYETSFYISKLVKAGNLKPHEFREGQGQDGNFFYTCDYRGRRTGWAIAGTAIVVAAVALPVAIGSSMPDIDTSF